MRGVLARYHDTCKGCVEKEHFLERIAAYRKKYGDRDDSAKSKKAKAAKVFDGDLETCKTEVFEARGRLKVLEQELEDARAESNGLRATLERMEAGGCDFSVAGGGASSEGRHVLLEGEEDGDFVLEETDDYILEEVWEEEEADDDREQKVDEGARVTHGEL